MSRLSAYLAQRNTDVAVCQLDNNPDCGPFVRHPGECLSLHLHKATVCRAADVGGDCGATIDRAWGLC